MITRYCYMSADFFESVKSHGGIHEEGEAEMFEVIACPDCGELWHFAGYAPLLPKIGNA